MVSVAIIYIAVVTYASPMVTCVIYRRSQQPRVERRRCFDLRVEEARWRGVAWWPGALLRLAFCFLLFQNKPMATRPLLVVCALATRSPPLMQARPATSGLKDDPGGEHAMCTELWGFGSHLSNEPSVPEGSVCGAQCTGQQAQRCARRIGAAHGTGGNQLTVTARVHWATSLRSSPHQIHGTAAWYHTWHRISVVLGANQPIHKVCTRFPITNAHVSFTSHWTSHSLGRAK